MNEQREAIINLLDPIVGPAYASNAPESADAVIQYLWQRADDPEVVEAVAAGMYNRAWTVTDPLLMWSELMPHQHIGWRKKAKASIKSNLTALLGPRPSGEESEHGQ